jgi:hypothetical protein
VGRQTAAGRVTFPGNRGRQQDYPMLRKLMWTGLYAGLGALATMVARRAAVKIWVVMTGEEPPTKK